jgi:hypothetical protein
VEERQAAFWAKVEINPGGCFFWKGGRTPGGYGRFADGRGSNEAAHRVAYRWLVGPIPPGMQLDHLCHNRACVNPAHLEPVTHVENIVRRIPHNVPIDRCKRGHEFSAANTYLISGKRKCRTCWLAAMKRQRDRKRAA